MNARRSQIWRSARAEFSTSCRGKLGPSPFCVYQDVFTPGTGFGIERGAELSAMRREFLTLFLSILKNISATNSCRCAIMPSLERDILHGMQESGVGRGRLSVFPSGQTYFEFTIRASIKRDIKRLSQRKRSITTWCKAMMLLFERTRSNVVFVLKKSTWASAYRTFLFPGRADSITHPDKNFSQQNSHQPTQ
jgi:hypothetical protein